MISERLKAVIFRTLDLDDFDLQDDKMASQVPGWDSLTHVKVLTAVESAYAIRFKTLEVLRLKSVGDLQTLIDRKMNAV